VGGHQNDWRAVKNLLSVAYFLTAPDKLRRQPAQGTAAKRALRGVKAKGVTIARDLCDQPYGNRNFDVEDCNGYRLCFGHDIET
jgi:hypothetical protein